MPSILITKADGEQEPFDLNKLRESLTRAGVPEEHVDSVVRHVLNEVHDGMSTSAIYSHAFSYLHKSFEAPIAARYSVKRAVFDLGPSGYPFEQFVAAILRMQGYSARTGLALTGKCAPHEVDVLAELKGHKVGIEVKFHNTPGVKTDLKDALYVHARFEDLKAAPDEASRVDEGWLVTNTRFTRNAIRYGRCAGLTMVGWDYPRGHGILGLIEETGIHPITCLTTLNQSEKRHFLDQNIVLCKAIRDDHALLGGIGITGQHAKDVLAEANQLCSPMRAPRSASFDSPAPVPHH
ncbi:MAG: restriction endonuclease [Candidatus Pacebacteria bacterium]|nr:restriction endonuclease [Candidatus Paceibacterota bacterium]